MKFLIFSQDLPSMVVEWREREHSDDDDIILSDPGAINALKQCGLLKFFKVPNMKAQKQLLRKLIEYWDPVDESFTLDEDPLHLEVDDIYFLTGLSRRGQEISLTGIGPKDLLTVREYTALYCTPDTRVNSSGVPIRFIRDLGLRAIVYTINRMAGSAAGHLATRPYMGLALSCLEPQLYDWCSAVRSSMVKQLTACHEGQKKEFGYGSLLCSFFFEKVPGLQPKMVIEPSPPMAPRMLRWGVHFFRLGGGVGARFYDEAFFSWWDRQVMAIDDYCFADVDFRNDPELVLPPDAQWGRIGMTSKFFCIYKGFEIL